MQAGQPRLSGPPQHPGHDRLRHRDLVINTPTRGRRHDTDGFKIRRSTVEHSVACITAIDTARAMLTVRTQGRAAELRPIDITEI